LASLIVVGLVTPAEIVSAQESKGDATSKRRLPVPRSVPKSLKELGALPTQDSPRADGSVPGLIEPSGPAALAEPLNRKPAPDPIADAVAKLPAPGEPAALTKPRELAWARTETSRVFLNPDGTHSVEVSNDRVNFKDDAGEWQPIDSSVGPSQADLSVLENAANDFTVTFAPLSKGGVKVVGPDGAELSFVPDVARDVAPKVGSKPNHVIYPEVWPGVDVEYIVRPSGVEEVLNVKRNPGRGTFPFLVGGAELRPSEGGGFDTFTKGKPSSLTVAPVSVTDRRGVAIDAAKAKPASAVGEVPQDSARRSSPAVKERFASPRRMDVAVDAGWLASLPAGEFPVRIDPTIGSAAPVWVQRRVKDNPSASCYDVPAACQTRVGTLAGAKVRSYSRIELGQIWFWRTLLDLDVESASIELRADTTGVAWPPASTSVSAFDSMWPTGAGGTYAYADIEDPAAIPLGDVDIDPVSLNGSIDISSFFDLWQAVEESSPGSINFRDLGIGGNESGVYSWMNLDPMWIRATFVNQAPGAAIAWSGVNQTANPPVLHELNTINTSVQATVVDLDGDTMSGYYEMCTLAAAQAAEPGEDCDGQVKSEHSGLTNTSGVPAWNVPLRWQEYYVVRFVVDDGVDVAPSPWVLLRSEIPTVTPTWHTGSDPYGGFAGGVNLANGSYFASQTDVTVASVGPGLASTRSYNSMDTRNGAFGKGWTSPYEMSVEWMPAAPGVAVLRPDGKREFYGKNPDGTYGAPLGSSAKMVETAGPTWTLTDPDSTVYTFDATGVLTGIVDEANRALQLTYTSGLLSQVKDAVSQRSLFYTWSTPAGATRAHVASVSTDSVTGAGSSTWTYGYAPGDLLSDVWDPINPSPSANKNHFDYDGSARLLTWTNSRIKTEAALTYDGSGRVATRADGVGATFTYAYTVPSPVAGETQQTTVWDPRRTASEPVGGETTWGFDQFHRLVRRTNEAGKDRKWTYDLKGFLQQINYEDSSAEVFTNDDNGNAVAKTDRWGKTTYFVFDAKNRVTEVRDARSADKDDTTYRTTTVYNALGNVERITPPAPLGETVTSYTDGSETPVPAGGTVPVGLPKQVTSPLGGQTTTSYNAKGDVTRIVDPAGKTTNITYDELGREISRTDTGIGIPVGATWSKTYDKVSRVLTETEPTVTNVVTAASRQRRTTNTYDPNGNLTQSQDGPVTAVAADPPRTQAFTYDNNDRELTRTVTVGVTAITSTKEYDRNGNVIAAIDQEGRRFETAYNSRNLETTRTLKTYQADPVGGSTPFDLVVSSVTYDDAGRKATVTDAEGRVQQFTYTINDEIDVAKLLAFDERDTTTSDLVIADNDYDNIGNVTATWDGNGTRQTVTTYDPAGLKSKETVFQGAAVPGVPAATKLRETTYAYDLAGNATSITQSGLGVVSDRVQRSHIASNGLKDWEEIENGPGVNDDLRTLFQHDARGLAIVVTDPDGKNVTTTFDVLSRATNMKSASVPNESGGGSPVSSQPESKLGYNTFGEVTHQADANGRVTTHEFDQLGRETKITQPTYTPPGGAAVTPFESMTYDKVGNLVSKVDRRGKTSTFEFDKLNRVFRSTTPGTVAGTPAVTLLKYDKVGNVTSTTDPIGAVTLNTYDDLNRTRLTTKVVRQPSTHNVTTTFDYDRLGNLTWKQDPAAATIAGSVAAVTTQVFNAAGDRLSVTDPLSHTTTFTPSPFGEVLSTVNAMNRQTTATYDQAGRQITATNVGNIGGGQPALTTAFTYDERSNLLTTTSPAGRVSKSTYDNAGRLTDVTQGFGTAAAVTTSYFYDAAGNNTRIRNGRGLDTIIEYQPWNLPESRIEPATVAGQPVANRRWRRSYDAAGLPAKDEQPGAVSVARTFDEAGRTKTETATGATGSRTFTYDVAGRPATVSHPTATINATFDDRGLPLTVTGGASSTTYSWDDASRLTQRVDAAGTTGFAYDAAGRVAAQTDPNTGKQLTSFYEDDNRLIAATYDPIGSGGWSGGAFVWQSADDYGRTGQNLYFPNGSDPVTYAKNYYYDNDSQLAYESVDGTSTPADNGWHSYTYTPLHQLESWTKPSGAVVNYAYDGAGNRTQAGGSTFVFDNQNRVTSGAGTTFSWSLRGTQTSSVTGGVTTNRTYDAFGLELTAGTVTYTYDGLGRIAARNGTALKYNGTGIDPIADGTWTTVQNQSAAPLSIKSGATANWALLDAHNDLVALMSPATGAVSNTTSYDPFGKVEGRTGSIVPTVGFQGDFTDPTTSEVWMGARFYQPANDTFTSRDTYDGKLETPISLNRYTYGDDNPLNGVDWDGHRMTYGTSSSSSFVSPNPAQRKAMTSPAAKKNLRMSEFRAKRSAKKEADARKARLKKSGKKYDPWIVPKKAAPTVREMTLTVGFGPFSISKTMHSDENGEIHLGGAKPNLLDQIADGITYGGKDFGEGLAGVVSLAKDGVCVTNNIKADTCEGAGDRVSAAVKSNVKLGICLTGVQHPGCAETVRDFGKGLICWDAGAREGIANAASRCGTKYLLDYATGKTGQAATAALRARAPVPVAPAESLIDDVARAPRSSTPLKDMASEVRDAGLHPAARNQRVIAVGSDGSGGLHAGSSNGFDAGQRAALERLGINRVPGSAKLHAEEELLRALDDLKKVGTSKRMPCGPSEHDCLRQLVERGVEIEE
jgi:RHS repeat-associated protein